jgi:hypothetical protein
MGRPLSGDDQAVAGQLERVHPVPGLPSLSRNRLRESQGEALAARSPRVVSAAGGGFGAGSSDGSYFVSTLLVGSRRHSERAWMAPQSGRWGCSVHLHQVERSSGQVKLAGRVVQAAA